MANREWTEYRHSTERRVVISLLWEWSLKSPAMELKRVRFGPVESSDPNAVVMPAELKERTLRAISRRARNPGDATRALQALGWLEPVVIPELPYAET